jgi:hypothetical protein
MRGGIAAAMQAPWDKPPAERTGEIMPQSTLGRHGMRRPRKWCRAPQSAITSARMPCCQQRMRSLTI